MVLMSGCSDVERLGYVYGKVPPDFSVSIRIVNERAGDNGGGDGGYENLLREPGCYLLDVDRSYRGISGFNADMRTYPPVIRIATHMEVEKIYEVVDEHNLMSEPTSLHVSGGVGMVKDVPQVVYCVELTANGRISSYSTTAVESPGTVRLLSELIELGNGRIGGASKGL